MSRWRLLGRRGARPDLPPLASVPPVAELPEAVLQSGARYLGTTLAGEPDRRVTSRGLGARSSTRLSLSAEVLDVVRLAGSFRIPAGCLRGARHAAAFLGAEVPDGVLVVTWAHGDQILDTGFHLLGDGEPARRRGPWVRRLSAMAREPS